MRPQRRLPAAVYGPRPARCIPLTISPAYGGEMNGFREPEGLAGGEWPTCEQGYQPGGGRFAWPVAVVVLQVAGPGDPGQERRVGEGRPGEFGPEGVVEGVAADSGDRGGRLVSGRAGLGSPNVLPGRSRGRQPPAQPRACGSGSPAASLASAGSLAARTEDGSEPPHDQDGHDRCHDERRRQRHRPRLRHAALPHPQGAASHRPAASRSRRCQGRVRPHGRRGDSILRTCVNS